jgi:hypothetical protein
MVDDSVRQPAQRLASLLEPLIGQVYFSPEAHANYVSLGFAPSPGQASGVALPDGPAYFTSRGSALGQVPGHVVAAAFGVFSPSVVIGCVTHGWSLTDAATIAGARHDGAVAQLVRVLGAEPESLNDVVDVLERLVAACQPAGRPLFSGLLARPAADDLMGRFFQAGDRLREYRGDSHNAAWITEDLTACQIGLLTELYWGLALRSYSRTRGWTEAEYAEALDGLRSRDLLDGEGFSPKGRALRQRIEDHTDQQMRRAMLALGNDAEPVFNALEPWGVAMRAAKGYLSSGPHDLAAVRR